MIRRMFRPFIIITIVGFIISLISSPKPGVHVVKNGPHITNVVSNSTTLSIMSIVMGTLSFVMIGVIVEIIFWIVKKMR